MVNEKDKGPAGVAVTLPGVPGLVVLLVTTMVTYTFCVALAVARAMVPLHAVPAWIPD